MRILRAIRRAIRHRPRFIGIRPLIERAWDDRPRMAAVAEHEAMRNHKPEPPPGQFSQMDEWEAQIQAGAVPSPRMALEMVKTVPTVPVTRAHDILKQPLTAARVREGTMEARRTNRRFYPSYYSNPHKGIQETVIQTVTTQLFPQLALNLLMKLVMGKKVRPELYLKHPSGDPVTDNAELKRYQWIVDVMEACDRRVGKEGEYAKAPAGRTEFNDQLGMLVRCALTYGRAALIVQEEYEPLTVARIDKAQPEAPAEQPGAQEPQAPEPQQYDEAVDGPEGDEVEEGGAQPQLPQEPAAPPVMDPSTAPDVEYKGLPGGLQFVHARDLGMVRTNGDGDLVSVDWDMTGATIEWKDMIYLWNSQQGEEVKMSKWFGLSIFEGVMLSLRALYQIEAVDVPSAAKALHTGSALIAYKVDSLDPDIRAREVGRIRDAIQAGSVGVVQANPAELEVKAINVTVDPAKNEAVIQRIYRSVCSACGVPQSVIFDEAASNRATLTGKLIFTTKATVGPIRDWIDREVTPQWYGLMLPLILEANKEESLLKKIGVKMRFDDLSLEADEDVVEAIFKLNQMAPLTDEGLMYGVGRPELIPFIDPQKKAEMRSMGMVPGMQANDDERSGGGGEWEGGDSD